MTSPPRFCLNCRGPVPDSYVQIDARERKMTIGYSFGPDGRVSIHAMDFCSDECNVDYHLKHDVRDLSRNPVIPGK